MRGLEKNRMGRGHTSDIPRTSRLLDRIGPVGRFDENRILGSRTRGPGSRNQITKIKNSVTSIRNNTLIARNKSGQSNLALVRSPKAALLARPAPSLPSWAFLFITGMEEPPFPSPTTLFSPEEKASAPLNEGSSPLTREVYVGHGGVSRHARHLSTLISETSTNSEEGVREVVQISHGQILHGQKSHGHISLPPHW